MSQQAPVFRTIDRPARLFGLEVFDAVLWCTTFILLKWTLVWALAVITVSWLGLFALRFRRPSGFLLSFVRFHAFRALGGNRYSAAELERARGPWLSARRTTKASE